MGFLMACLAGQTIRPQPDWANLVQEDEDWTFGLGAD
jgi:hypothetical protein